jgi:outer membrane lipoprotein-sorting protein
MRNRREAVAGLLLAALAATALPAAAQAPTPPVPATEPASAEEVLERIDRQMTFESRSGTAVMRIIEPGDTREKDLRLFARGQRDSYIVFLKPDRDKGTKMLKLQGQLWIYFPRTEKDVKISGHMMRQSMMGSDFSYEDMADNPRLLEDYDAEMLPAEELGGEPVWVLRLREKRPGLSYPERKLWVSKRYELPLREERFGKNGRLLKVMSLSRMQQFEDRWYPTLFVMEDKLKQGTRTEIEMQELKFRIPVPEEIFDRRNLRREIAF